MATRTFQLAIAPLKPTGEVDAAHVRAIAADVAPVAIQLR
jgi:hypothetical protein